MPPSLYLVPKHCHRPKRSPRLSAAPAPGPLLRLCGWLCLSWDPRVLPCGGFLWASRFESVGGSIPCCGREDSTMWVPSVSVGGWSPVPPLPADLPLQGGLQGPVGQSSSRALRSIWFPAGCVALGHPRVLMASVMETLWLAEQARLPNE